jgi:hypothetical protein
VSEEMEEADFFLVPAHYVDTVWSQIVPHLMKGEKEWKQFYSLDQLYLNLISGSQNLWVMIEGKSKILGIVLTQLDSYPEKKAVRILFLGGTGFKRYMMKKMVKIENWAKKNGAALVDILGRDEWFTLIKGYGYSDVGRVYRKEL